MSDSEIQAPPLQIDSAVLGQPLDVAAGRTDSASRSLAAEVLQERLREFNGPPPFAVNATLSSPANHGSR